MKKITMVFALTLLAALTFQTQAQNGGNDCASAVVAVPGMFTETTINDATPGTNTGDSAWFVYTAAANGTININSCSGGADTRLFIWNDCADGAAAANNDDAANCPINVDGTGNSFASRIEDFVVTVGEDYYIQWDDRWSVNAFNWTLEFVPPPSCPEVANIVITPTAFDAAISWDAVVEATNGYVVNVFEDGADPMVDAPVYTENIAVGTLMTTATGLMQDTNYDAYVIADCAAVGLSMADVNNFSTEIACNQAENFIAAMATTTEITYSWDDVAEAIDGFTLNVFDAGADPMVDTPVYTEMLAAAVTTATATGLMEATLYDAYLISECGDVNGMSSAATETSGTDFTVDESCGGRFLDSGGPVGNYSAGEATTTTIMPDTPGQIVTVTFTYVDIETRAGNMDNPCWDFLTVYDGPDTDSPVLAAQLCGEESGDGGVAGNPDAELNIGDSFTSTHPSGALTFVFTSDGSVQETGWEADITCSEVPCEAPENFAVSNIADTTADLTWDVAPSAADGYQTAVFIEGADPLTEAPIYASALLAQATTTDTATGLTAEVAYDAYIISICDIDSDPLVFSFSEPVTFNTVLDATSFETVTFTAVPNPADGIVTIKTNVTIDSLAVYNLLGQVVLERTPNATDFTLDVTSLESGTYFIKASADGNTTTHKLIRR